jgi:AraC family transcriptional regulator
MMNEQTQISYRERMTRVLCFIEENLDEPISLEELADVACFSPYHFHRVFRGMVGETVKGYVRRLRLERAAAKLTFAVESITTVALDAGYDSHEAFIRAFRAQFGCAPGEYRHRTHAERIKSLLSDITGPDSTANILKSKLGDAIVEARIETLPKTKVAFVRHLGPYDQCGVAWEKLCRWAGPKGLLAKDTVFLGICHDDPEITPPDKIRYDASIVVTASVPPENEVGVTEIGGAEFAVATHLGAYEKLHNSYAEMAGRWIPSQGRECASAPSLEFYRNSPEDTPPEKLVTDIYIPLK